MTTLFKVFGRSGKDGASDAIVVEEGFEIGFDVSEDMTFVVLSAVLAGIFAVHQSVDTPLSEEYR